MDVVTNGSERKMKNFKKISKKGAVLLAGLLVIGMIAGAAMMNRYMQRNGQADSQVILEYSATGDFTGEEVNAEDLDMPIDVGDDFVGNDTEYFEYWMKCNPDLDNDLDVNWTITDTSTDDPEGLTISLQYNNSGTWEDVFEWVATDGGSLNTGYTFSPGDADHLRVVITGHDYLIEGEYSFSLDLEASSQI